MSAKSKSKKAQKAKKSSQNQTVRSIDQKAILRYLQTRKAYLMIIFKCEDRKFDNRTQKHRLIQSVIHKLNEEYGIEVEELVDNCYITKKRHALSKLLRVVKEIEEIAGKNTYLFVRAITLKNVKGLLLDEMYKKTLQSLLRVEDLPRDVKAQLKRELLRLEKKELATLRAYKAVHVPEKISRQIGNYATQSIKTEEVKRDESKEEREVKRKKKEASKKKYRLIIVIKKGQGDKREKWRIVQKVLKELKEHGLEMEKVINNVYVSTTKTTLAKLVEAVNIIKKYGIEAKIFAGLKVTRSLLKLLPEGQVVKEVEDARLVEASQASAEGMKQILLNIIDDPTTFCRRRKAFGDLKTFDSMICNMAKVLIDLGLLDKQYFIEKVNAMVQKWKELYKTATTFHCDI